MRDFLTMIFSQIIRFNKKLICIIIVVLISSNLFSQEESGIFTSDEPFNPKSTGKLFLAFDNLNFFKNNEYKSNYVNGYTLTGAWIRPKLIFYPDEKLRIELGGQILTYSGREDYKLYPWFSVLYKPAENISFRMGNLSNDQNHGLSVPVMDTEHFLNGQPEAGIQAKFRNDWFNAESWIDWQKMIFQGDPFKEKFVFGFVSGIRLFERDNLELSMPITFNGLHEGGEIDAAPGLAKTHIAVSEGITLIRKLQGSRVQSWFAQAQLFQSTYPEGETTMPSKNGSATYFRTGLVSTCGKITAGYWRGSRFFTPLGMPLFQNAALNQPNYAELNKLWTLSYLYDRKIFGQSKFGFMMDLFYNPATQKISNTAALYLMINFSVLFRKNAI